jgi:hypothetical protein
MPGSLPPPLGTGHVAQFLPSPFRAPGAALKRARVAPKFNICSVLLGSGVFNEVAFVQFPFPLNTEKGSICYT